MKCPMCGRENADDAPRCVQCHVNLAAIRGEVKIVPSPKAPITQPIDGTSKQVKRPFLVFLLGWLTILGSFVGITAYILIQALANHGALGAYSVAEILIALGVAAAGWLFLKGNGWARTLLIVLYVLGLLGSIVILTISIFAVIGIVPVVVILYILIASPQVKEYFGAA